MKVWSDTLTTSDLYAAGRRVGVTVEAVQMSRPRTRARGWTVYLGGSSPHRSQATGGPAATWDEHGLWMEDLFCIDPRAKITTYDGRADFIEQTQEAVDRQRRYVEEYGGRPRPDMSAPWLARAARLEELRAELRAERISWGELAELQGLARYIDRGDVELLEAAGVPEGEVA